MGASAWSYFVPFQSDIHKAFQELRWNVYKYGKYIVRVFPNPDSFSFNQFINNRIGLTKADLEAFEEAYSQEIERLKIIPNSPDSLLQKYGYNGTHSIIDIKEISTVYNEIESGPLSNDILIDLFRTIKPSHDLIINKEVDIQAMRGPYFCTYIIVYNDDQPSEIFFAGNSGD